MITYRFKTTLAASLLAVAATGTPVQAADTGEGARLYNTHCTGCHGARGTGMMAGMPDFSRGERLMQSDAQLARSIEGGKSVMPAFRGLLTPADILDVIAYVRTLR